VKHEQPVQNAQAGATPILQNIFEAPGFHVQMFMHPLLCLSLKH
jgi:hypothetical protein